jgi:hypothetical protein
MAADDIDILLVPKIDSDQWWQEIHDHHRKSSEAEQASPKWDASGNDSCWADFFPVRRDEETARLNGLI